MSTITIVEWENGTKCWYRNGKLHREDGPAIEYADGSKDWYRNGKLLKVEDKQAPQTPSTDGWFSDAGEYLQSLLNTGYSLKDATDLVVKTFSDYQDEAPKALDEKDIEAYAVNKALARNICKAIDEFLEAPFDAVFTSNQVDKLEDVYRELDYAYNITPTAFLKFK